MNDLISVEYTSKISSKKEKDDKAFLDGFVGEVKRSSYIRALREAKLRDINGDSNPVKVQVRFCLNVPGSLVGFYPNWGFGKHDVDEQGIPVPVRSLKPTKRVCISNYERRPIGDDKIDIASIFEKPVFYSTNSYKKFSRVMLTDTDQLGLNHGWTWSKESRSASPDKPLVFMECRIYGADTVLPVYSSSRFRGIVIQILSRDLAAGYSERMTSDVYVLANTREYVEYVDGVSVERERLSNIRSLANSLCPPREYMLEKQKNIKSKADAEAKKAEAKAAAETAAK
jgi:hypothetical protein